MSVDELRTGFARLTESVVPDEDPYALLLRQHTRRRRRVRFAGIGGGLATLLTTALLGSGIVGLGPAGPGDGKSGPRFRENGYPVTSDATWQLIDSPARGNLGDDRALVDGLTRAFVADRVGQMAAALPDAKVLFVHDFPTARLVIVAYHSDSRASLVTRMARRGASAQELVMGGGIMNARVEPFLVVSEALQGGDDWSVRFTLGLAPAGCAVDVSDAATIGPADQGIQRNWRPAPGGDYVLDERVPATGYWQATCGGTLRHRAPLAIQLGEVTGSAVEAAPVTPSAGATTIDTPTASAAIGSYRELARRAGFGDSLNRALAPAVRWAGPIFGDDRTGDESPPAVLVSPSAPGPVLLQIGPGVKGMLALAGRDDPAPDESAAPDSSREEWSLVSTGYTNSADLIAVRIPERNGGQAALSDRLLVVGRSTDASYSVTDAAGNELASARPEQLGAALFTVPLGTKATVRALDAAGRTIASTELIERDTGQQMFGEVFLSEW